MGSYQIKNVVMDGVTYGPHLVYTDALGFQWALVLRINADNTEFNYTSALWTNDTLLNQDVFDLNAVSNSKYRGFTTLPITDKIMIQMNGINLRLNASSSVIGKSFKTLFNTITNTGANVQDFKEAFTSNTLSNWGISRTGATEVINVTNLGFNIVDPAGASKTRLGLLCNNVSTFQTSGDTQGTSEGLGCYSINNNTPINVNSGATQWIASSTAGRVYKGSNVFIRLNIKSPKERSHVSLLTPGDFIKCRYSCPAPGTIPGIYTELGITTAPEIPYTGLSNPDGTFYLIHVGYDRLGRMKLIGDRSTHRSISWDALSGSGLATTEGIVTDTLGYSANLCYGQTYYALRPDNTASVDNTASNTPAYAFNGTVNYSGISSGDTCNPRIASDNKVGCKFSTPKVIKRMRVFPYWDNTITNYCPYHWYVVASNDGITWFKIPVKKWLNACRPYNNDECETFVKNDWSEVILDNNTSYLYYGIYMRDHYYTTTAWGSTPVSEIEMYEKAINYTDNMEFTIRLVSGGTGPYDTFNEWDQLLTGAYNSIDVDVWNFESGNWTLTTGSTNANRVGRGFATAPYNDQAVASTAVGTAAYRPMILVDCKNNAPQNQVSVDKLITLKDPIKLTGLLKDLEKDGIAYKISINGVLQSDWSPTYDSQVLIDATYSITQDTVIELSYKDTSNNQVTKAYSVRKKYNEIVHIDYANANTNYVNDYPRISPTKTALMSIEVNAGMGYINKVYLNLNVLSGNIGQVNIGLVNSTWKSDSVTYANRPQLDTNVITANIVYGVNKIDITSLVNKLYNQANYGLYISTDNADLQLDLQGNDYEITYQPTVLNQPKVVYGDRCLISWKPIVYFKPEAIQYIQIWRDTKSDFSTEISVYQTNRFDVLQFTDTGLSNGTYYYRIKVVFIHNAYTGTQLDFDVADRSLFMEQDKVNGTDFVSGYVALHLLSDVTSVTFDMSSDTGFSYGPTSIAFGSGVANLFGTEEV